MAVSAATLLAAPTPAQRHGMHRDGGFPRSGPAAHRGGGERREHGGERRLLNTNGFFAPAYLYADNEYDQEPDAVSVPPVQVAVMQPTPPAPPVPVEPLLMEKRNGEWVRVATGKQMAASQPAPADSAKPTTPHPAIVAPSKARSKAAAPAAAPVVALPSAVIVFRDGHQEEIAKYVIQGDVLYTNSVSANGVSRERQIPLAQLDLPASLKASKDRGAKFNLPSAPNEVIVRF